MNDVAALRSAVDELETGLGGSPDLSAIHREARRLRRRHRLAEGVGVAAATATVVAVLAATHSSQDAARTAFGASGDDGRYVALVAPGWSVGSAEQEPGFSEVEYDQGGEQLTITQYDAAQYASYYADRQDIGPGRPIELLGRDATTWAYSDQDHTVIRTPADGRFVEVRGSGMDEDTYQATLDQLVQTDAAGLAQGMPEGAVTPDNHDRAIAHLLQGVDLPPGFSAADVRLTGVNDTYLASAQVAGQVGCAWINVYLGGSPADQKAAVAAFRSSRQWPLLVDIAGGGDYSKGFWSVAGQLSGQVGTSSLADVKQVVCS